MPFYPAIPVGGLAGLRLLDRTMDRQVALFERSPDVQREIDYFNENAGSITTLDGLMQDRRILGVVLGAFGLDDDLDKRAFIRKVIEEGTVKNDAFANRLVDPAYRQMSSAVGFGDVGGLLILPAVQETIVNQYRERQFEKALGEVDIDLRLALNFRRAAQEVVESSGSGSAGWLRLLGSPPTREVLTTALGLPPAAAGVDIDQQVSEIARRAEQLLGSDEPSVLNDPEVMRKVVDRFLMNKQLATGAFSSGGRGTAALSILQSAGLGSGGQAGLFASNFV